MSNPTHFEIVETFYAAVDKLKSLPTDPGEIADLLVAENVKGYCNNPWHCALINYAVEKATDDKPIYGAAIFGDYFLVSHGEDDEFEHMWNLPPHLHKFATMFDQGMFQQLVSPGTGPTNP